MAIGRLPENLAAGDRADRARAIFHGEPPAFALRQLSGDQAADDIRGRAYRKRNENADDVRGKSLGGDGKGGTGQRQRREYQHKAALHHCLLVSQRIARVNRRACAAKNDLM